METKFRIIQFFAQEESISQLGDLAEIDMQEANIPQIKRVGDTCVLPCKDGYFVLLAVKPFQHLWIADSSFGNEWRKSAIQAIKNHLR